jgi:hypothetical protein
MAGIDLGVPSPAAGAEVAGFGADVERLGIELGRQTQQKPAPEQQALLDAQSAKELIAAKSLAFDKVNTFNNQLDQNTDYSTFNDAWNTTKSDINASAESMLTLPKSQEMFQQWWLGEAETQAKYVQGEARKRTVAAANAQGTVALENYADKGSEYGIKDTLNTLVSQGVMDASQAASAASKYIPQARYNLVLQHLDSLDDPYGAMDELTEPNASDRFQISPEQVSKMTDYFKGQAANRTLAAQERAKAKQEQLFKDFVTNAADPMTAPTAMDAKKLQAAMVGSPYYDHVAQYATARQAQEDKINAERIKTGMTDNYSKFATSMMSWNGNGKPPWGPNDIGAALSSKDDANRINESEFNELKSLYQRTMDDLASGKQKGPNHDDPNRVADMTRIVYDEKMSASDKYDAIKPFFANGVSPEKWSSLRADIDEYDKRTDWKNALTPINAYYHAAIADPANIDKRQQLSLEQGAAEQAMMSVFRKYPNDPAMWKQASDDIMNKNALPNMIDKVQNDLKAKYPSLMWAFGGISQATQIETARQLGGGGAEIQKESIVHATEIEQEQRKILANAGVNVVDSWRDPVSGTWWYSTQPFPRDRTGKVDLKAVGQAGNLYQVQERAEGGRFSANPVRMRPK